MTAQRRAAELGSSGACDHRERRGDRRAPNYTPPGAEAEEALVLGELALERVRRLLDSHKLPRVSSRDVAVLRFMLDETLVVLERATDAFFDEGPPP